jgi:ribosome-associated toxin RatA of RatAB toxin-antitoxin module
MKDIVKDLFTVLLAKADKSPEKQVRMSKTEKTMKAYLDNDPQGIRETFHQEFKRLEAEQIIAIKWHNPNILLQYIQLIDADQLALQVGYSRLGNRFEQAKQMVESKLTDSPHLKAVYDLLFNKWQSTGMFEG